MTVYIIVLHYKNTRDTFNCLRSITRLKIDDSIIKTIVVANDTRNLQPTNYNLIKNSRNLGFAAGVNVGIREALNDKNAAYVLILNNDTILPPNLLTELLKTPVDITAPVIKFKWDNNWKYDFGGKVNWLTGRTTHIEKITSGRWPDGLLPGELGKIDYVSGCCMLIRRKVFEKIGLFDEKFFFYFEDADFCVRAKRIGLKIAVNPNTTIYHKLGSAIGRWTNKAIFYNLVGNFIFISKHLDWKRPIGYIYLVLLTGKIIINKIIGK